jgi:hypothetical protein
VTILDEKKKEEKKMIVKIMLFPQLSSFSRIHNMQ